MASVLYIFFGPALFHSARRLFHQHIAIAIGLISAALFVIALYTIRKVFDRRRGVRLPVEEQA